jgi:hypothetical protein
MLRSFIPLSAVCVACLMSFIYGMLYSARPHSVIPALIIAVMAFYELCSELIATKNAGRSKP